ncbi:MAG: DUF3472 domain-containing protein [Gemmataceae bacterium]|nr:DUF3472 domain-containing protein [Gemmataceae bacterium]
MSTRALSLVAVLLAATTISHADEKLKGIACRSVHLGYPVGEGVVFHNEVRVDRSAPGTYFAVCGWDKGYFGIQELGNGKKLAIFSVWDSKQNDPKAVAEDRRTKLLHKDEKVRVGRFGGEGTGGQSFFDYDWKANETYRFIVASKIDGERTEYAGYFFVPETSAWKHMVTFSTVTGGKNMRGYYSFVEDFERDRVSATKARQAHFGNAWVKTTKGDWTAATKARFTGDANPVTNINAGIDSGLFFLATGGETENTGTKLNATMDLPAANRSVPKDLPAAVR